MQVVGCKSIKDLPHVDHAVPFSSPLYRQKLQFFQSLPVGKAVAAANFRKITAKVKLLTIIRPIKYIKDILIHILRKFQVTPAFNVGFMEVGKKFNR